MSDLKKYNTFGDVKDGARRDYPGFLVLGVGLPRTGTMSLRVALTRLLGGKCYHGIEVRAQKTFLKHRRK